MEKVKLLIVEAKGHFISYVASVIHFIAIFAQRSIAMSKINEWINRAQNLNNENLDLHDRIDKLQKLLREINEGLDEIDSQASWKEYREIRDTVTILQKRICAGLE